MKESLDGLSNAAGGLEPPGEQLFLAHLQPCARCERELAVHQATLAQLAYAPDAAGTGRRRRLRLPWAKMGR